MFHYDFKNFEEWISCLVRENIILIDSCDFCSFSFFTFSSIFHLQKSLSCVEMWSCNSAKVCGTLSKIESTPDASCEPKLEVPYSCRQAWYATQYSYEVGEIPTTKSTTCGCELNYLYDSNVTTILKT